eukprot:COSAG01_NODE_11059_length_2018_cov_1.648775_2_plen_207_part_00
MVGAPAEVLVGHVVLRPQLDHRRGVVRALAVLRVHLQVREGEVAHDRHDDDGAERVERREEALHHALQPLVPRLRLLLDVAAAQRARRLLLRRGEPRGGRRLRGQRLERAELEGGDAPARGVELERRIRDRRLVQRGQRAVGRRDRRQPRRAGAGARAGRLGDEGGRRRRARLAAALRVHLVRALDRLLHGAPRLARLSGRWRLER